MAVKKEVRWHKSQVGPSQHDHRRSSSQWVPPSGPLYNPIEIFRSRSTRIKGSRMIQPNHLMEVARYNLPNYRQFTNNSITTTKYRLVSFVFLNVIHQMKTRYANIYFLFIAILNWIPAFQAYSKYLSLLPLMFVLGTTMIKDGYEDYRRWKFDKEINTRLCHVWDKDRKRFRKTQWKYILVGDFVHVSNDQELPADIIFMRSSNENGTCFVETSNLDGETSLKQRNVPRRYLEYSEENSGFIPPDFTDTLYCEKPDQAIYDVRAHIEYAKDRTEVVTKENMLLRGSKLKNTTFVEGVVLYAGHDTKVMQNNGRAPLKVSGIEHITNRFILVCVVLLILMVICGAVLSGFFVDEHDEENAPYIPTTVKKPVIAALLNVGTLIISYQVLVPISLYITVEIIKLAQIWFVSHDLDLYDEENDYCINCRSLNIPEELGQITHILSDKTGTLTENKMVFRNCAFDEMDNGSELEKEELDKFNPVLSPSLYVRVQDGWKTNDIMRHFFLNVVVNNSVVVNKRPHRDVIDIGTYEDGEYMIGNAIFYDITLEQFNDMIESINRPQTSAEDSVGTESVASLSVIPESSRNASTITSPVSMGPFSVGQVAGAVDSPAGSEAVLSRVSTFSKSIANVFKKSILTPLSSVFPGSEPPGLHQTSVEMEEESFCPYEAESPDELALIQGAALYDFKLEDRTGTHVKIRTPDGNSTKIPVLLVLPFDSHRKRMSVIIQTPEGILMYTKGADSAILDRLAEDSNDLSTVLAPMLHSYSSQGLRTLCFGMRQISREEFEDFKHSYEFIMHDTSSERQKMLSDKANEIERDFSLLGVTGIEDRLQDGVKETIESLRGAGIQVWVLTGDKLETAENIARSSGLFDEDSVVRRISSTNDCLGIGAHEHGFNLLLSPSAIEAVKRGEQAALDVLKRAKCVLCYRMTPAEKADIVTAVKTYLKGRVLAIGDGANDVAMIQAAHVGIGVKGKEGMQAVMACDFAIGRFRFLRKLLLVHGHWIYDRLSMAFLYFLYKNTNSVFILFFYQFFDGYSGSYTIDPTYAVLYPIIFTSVQPIVVGVLDQDNSAADLLKNPSLYTPGREGTLYTYPLFLVNIVDGIWQAAVIYFMAHLTLWSSVAGLWTLGFYLATGMMLVNCLHLAIEVRSWNSSFVTIFVAFFALHFGYFLIYPLIVGPGMIPDPPIQVPRDAMANCRFWMCMLLTTIISLFPRFLVRVALKSGLS